MRLSDTDRELLARFEKEDRAVPRQTDIRREGDENDTLFAVRKGWLYSFIDFPDGRRQIVKVHVPGDLIGFPELAYERVASSLRSCSAAIICPFPKAHVHDVIRESSRLAAAMLTVATRDQVLLIDRLRATGRMNARERIAHFLLDALARLRVFRGPDIVRFELPMSQQEIGDAVGLTNVYVSKTFAALERDNLIKRHAGAEIELLDEGALCRIADFNDRYRLLDTTWFS